MSIENKTMTVEDARKELDEIYCDRADRLDRAWCTDRLIAAVRAEEREKMQALAEKWEIDMRTTAELRICIEDARKLAKEPT